MMELPKRSDPFRQIALGGIENHSKWLQDSSASLVRYLKMLVERPSFESRAEDEMARAETALTEALATVKEMRQNYQAKPVEKQS